MDNEHRKITKWEQSEHQVERVRQQIASWLEWHRKRDKKGLHKSQFETIESVLMGASEALRGEIAKAKLRADQISLAEVYDECRTFDQAIIWVDRLWSFFRGKFDQRASDDSLASLLKAADEVIWSCYQQVFESTRLNASNPVPLCYIEPEYSPAAIVSDQPMPYGLRLEADIDFLDDFIAHLPMPVLRLPPWCVNSPWWLVFIAHEVGHHIQHELNLVVSFRQKLEKIVKDNQATDVEIKNWGKWSEEIFADCFSVLMMGQWATTAIMEVELSAEEKMLEQKDRYPAAVIRLLLMQVVTAKVGLQVDTMIGNLNLQQIADSDPQIARDYLMVEPVATAAMEYIIEKFDSIENFTGFDKSAFHAGGAIEYWAGKLSNDEQTIGEKHLFSARQTVCGSLKAWSEIVGIKEPQQRSKQLALLAKNTLNVLQETGPEGTRSDLQPDGVGVEKGTELMNLLLGKIKKP